VIRWAAIYWQYFTAVVLAQLLSKSYHMGIYSFHLAMLQNCKTRDFRILSKSSLLILHMDAWSWYGGLFCLFDWFYFEKSPKKDFMALRIESSIFSTSRSWNILHSSSKSPYIKLISSHSHLSWDARKFPLFSLKLSFTC
jgi:hypothetical protein